MVDWLVISADLTPAGRGVRGYTLAKFLRIYFGRRRVALQAPDQWRREPIAAETTLIGMPSSLTPGELQRLADVPGRRRLVAFDYLDQQSLAWTIEQGEALRRRTDRYLKPWFEQAWRYDLRMGMLPIRRYGRLTAAVTIDRCVRRLTGRPTPSHDVAFLGRPNETELYVDGRSNMVDQRFEWLRDLKRGAPELSLWGGLVEVSDETRNRLTSRYGPIADLLHSQSKVGFVTYYQAMRLSRVLLAPGGNVPWSYRHYECLYAGGAVVTIDYRRRDMLVPLPPGGVVHVPDGEPVIPAVHEALELSRRRPRLGEENVAHLERYLRLGAYSRRRPALLERFIAQLDE